MKTKFDVDRLLAFFDRCLNQWLLHLRKRAEALPLRLAEFRARAAREPLEKKHSLPVVLEISRQGPLTLRWREGRRRPPQWGESYYRYAWIRPRPLKKGGGYDPEVLHSFSNGDEQDLVVQLEMVAREIRVEYAELMLIRRKVAMIIARRRRRGPQDEWKSS